MDKKTLYFLVSETRILGHSEDRDDAIFYKLIQDAYEIGDRDFRVLEIDVRIGLPEDKNEDEFDIKIKNTVNHEFNSFMSDLITEKKLEYGFDFWQDFVPGIYRVKRQNGGRRLMFEYCPDIKDDEWGAIENEAWGNPVGKYTKVSGEDTEP